MLSCRVHFAVAIVFAAAIIPSPQRVKADDDSVVPEFMSEVARIEQEFAERIENYNQLLKQSRLDEAIVLGQQACLMQPDNPVSQVMLFKAKFLKQDAINLLFHTFQATLRDDSLDELVGQSASQPIRLSVIETLDQLAKGDDNDSLNGRSLLSASLEHRISRVDRIYGLTNAQKRKLRLAGGGDIKRFLNRIEQLNLTIERTQAGDDDDLILCGNADRLSPVRSIGMFGQGSLFMKTLKAVLTETQSAALDASTFSR
jgi:hypothetical protein